jgi:hypothetical protein
MEVDSDVGANFDFSGFDVKISAGCYQGISRESSVTITNEECMELLTGILNEQYGAVENVCSNDKVFGEILDYAINNSARVKSVIGESVFGLLESYSNESVRDHLAHRDRCEKEIGQLTKRVAELEATIRNAKEALGVSHLTVA